MEKNFALWLLVAVAAVGAVRNDGSASQQRPTFIARTDIARLEVRVLEKRTRKPGRGLRLEDFTLDVNEKSQRIVALSEVDIAATHAVPAAAWTAEATRDQTTNLLSGPRLFVIVMDDAMTPGDPYIGKMTRDVANRVVDQMGPGDLAAVVFTQDNRHAQDFTIDRRLLREAIDHYRARPLRCTLAEAMAMGTLRRSAAFLADLPGQKSIVFVSTGPTGCAVSRANSALQDNARVLVNQVLGEVRSAHVPIFTVSPAGLRGVGARGPFVGQAWQGTPALEVLARMSGGRMVANDNAPAAQVPALFEELSSYYAIAYELSFPLDAALRRLRVRVSRSDVEVHPGDLILETPKDTMPTRRVATGVVDAVAGALPDGDVPLGLTVVPVALPNSGDGRAGLVVTVAMLQPGALSVGVENAVKIALRVFDAEGRVTLATAKRMLQVTSRAGIDAYEMTMRVDVPRGRHNVRVATRRVSDGVAGSVYATTDVPDFSREPVSLSGVAVGRAEGAPVAGRESLGAALPFAPTALRTFGTTDHVGALLRIYRGRGRTSPSVIVTTEVIRDSGEVVHTAARPIAPEAFAGDAGVEHRFELPLATLAPGYYLLRFVATAGESRVQRDVRFSVTR